MGHFHLPMGSTHHPPLGTPKRTVTEREAAPVSCPAAGSHSRSHRGTAGAPTSLRESPALQCWDTHVMPRTVDPARRSSREGSGYTVSSLPPPRLSHAHSHTHMRAHTAPPQVPRSPTFLLPSPDPKPGCEHPAQPTLLPAHPGRTPRGCSRGFPSTAKEAILPAPLWAGRRAPPLEGQGKHGSGG